MALSSVSYVGDGSNKIFAVPFLYLAKSHVKVYVAGVEVTLFTWLTGTSISITTAPANLATVVIKRVTPTTPLVDFVDGSTLTESLLDTSSLQGIYVAEETKDTAVNSMLLDIADNKYEAGSKVIKNVAAPVSGTDAVNKTYADSTIPANVASAASSATSANNSAIAAASSATNALNSANAAAASAVAAAGYVVPSQTGNAGKWLKTDGVSVSWVQAASVGANGDITSFTGLTGSLGWTSTNPAIFYVNGAERARIDANGNLGVGATPSASWDSTLYKVVQLPANSSISTTIATGILRFSTNSYSDSGGNKYSSNGFGANVTTDPSNGLVSLKTYQSGVAGNTLTLASQFVVTQTDAVLTTPLGGIGYGSGAGGTVTQATSKATGVTLNKPTGKITSAADALGAGAEASFVLTNSLITATDVVVVNSISGNYSCRTKYAAAGSCQLYIKNETGGSLSTAVDIQFAIIKGAIA